MTDNEQEMDYIIPFYYDILYEVIKDSNKRQRRNYTRLNLRQLGARPAMGNTQR
ncbi:hypothetical protein PROFUN_16287 [Planoprotostelium fungivorum]|uniref:Uncharacterized protein n=1 Tax=Planoprotostelium fungivorum TaxID=1890364 RepID=A0A2P6MR87_9EUKA|nr:hypothetical protein PROFUN_16287 [Planoprotostelium fungivorum]